MARPKGLEETTPIHTRLTTAQRTGFQEYQRRQQEQVRHTGVQLTEAAVLRGMVLRCLDLEHITHQGPQQDLLSTAPRPAPIAPSAPAPSSPPAAPVTRATTEIAEPPPTPPKVDTAPKHEAAPEPEAKPSGATAKPATAPKKTSATKTAPKAKAAAPKASATKTAPKAPPPKGTKKKGKR